MLTLRRAVEELLAYCLPETVRNALDWSSLKPVKDSYVDEHLHESFADVVYTCGTISDAEVRVCFLFEHKSDKPAGAVALQILRYMLNIWESDTRQKRQPGPVVPIVIYHGHEPWEKEKLKSLVHPSGAFEPYLPDFDFIFLNLRTTSDAELLARGQVCSRPFSCY